MSQSKIIQLDYSNNWPNNEGVTLLCLSQDTCLLWSLHPGNGGKLKLVDRRHRTVSMTCAVMARQLYTVFVGTAGGNILAFWRPIPCYQTDKMLEMENRYNKIIIYYTY